ncbi:hypothetical protein DPV78_006863 [Talaromyces pinophilus]|nr:hypothetical protein DPV78_006863 [Talaromyces pinophilus]
MECEVSADEACDEVSCQFGLPTACSEAYNIPRPPIIKTAGLSVAMLTAVEVFTDSKKRCYLEIELVLRNGFDRSEMQMISEQPVATVVR